MADKKNASTEPIESVEAPQVAAESVAAPAPKFDYTQLNTLAVVSLAAAVTGFGAIAGVITGHIALAQIRATGAKGRALALAGVIVGYAGIAFALLGGVARVVAALVGNRYGVDLHSGYGLRNGNGFGGMMGGWDDQNGLNDNNNGGMMRNPDNGFVNPNGGGMMGWATPAPSASPQA